MMKLRFGGIKVAGQRLMFAISQHQQRGPTWALFRHLLFCGEIIKIPLCSKRSSSFYKAGGKKFFIRTEAFRREDEERHCLAGWESDPLTFIGSVLKISVTVINTMFSMFFSGKIRVRRAHFRSDTHWGDTSATGHLIEVPLCKVSVSTHRFLKKFLHIRLSQCDKNKCVCCVSVCVQPCCVCATA